MIRAPYVVDIMTPNPVIIGFGMSAWEAECLAEERSVHHLIVLEHYELVGEVCRCDLRRAKAGDKVEACMKTPPITVEDQLTATDALGIMSQCGVGCLPVVDWSGVLHGIVTRRDLRRAGVLPTSEIRICTVCGGTHGIRPAPGDGQVLLCVRCLEAAQQPLSEPLHGAVADADRD